MKEKLQSHCLKWMLGYLSCREHFIMDEWMSDVGFRMKDELLQFLITMNAL